MLLVLCTQPAVKQNIMCPTQLQRKLQHIFPLVFCCERKHSITARKVFLLTLRKPSVVTLRLWGILSFPDSSLISFCSCFLQTEQRKIETLGVLFKGYFYVSLNNLAVLFSIPSDNWTCLWFLCTAETEQFRLLGGGVYWKWSLDPDSLAVDLARWSSGK